MNDFSLAEATPLGGELVSELAYGILTRGYSVVPGFLPSEFRALLRDRLAQRLREYRPVPGSERSLEDRHLLHDLLTSDIVFARLLEDPRLQQLMGPLLGEHWIMYAFTSSSLPPNGSNYGRRMHVDSARFSAGYTFNVGIMWALDPFTRENGGTEVLPGSHHAEAAPEASYFERHRTQITCAPGDLIVFHGRLVHRAGENQTDVWRHALTMNCCRSFMKQRMDWVRAVPAQLADRLNPQARRLLGYDTRLPASLQELFLPQGQRLYKPNQG